MKKNKVRTGMLVRVSNVGGVFVVNARNRPDSYVYEDSPVMKGGVVNLSKVYGDNQTATAMTVKCKYLTEILLPVEFKEGE